MKKMKKIFALAIALVMVLGMSTSVFAASDGSITIQNTVKDKEYNIYKVFDATYSGTNVAYTYDGSNATFLAALQAENSPFTTTANTAGSYNVVIKESATDAAILEFIKGQAANVGSAVKTLTGDGKTQTAKGLGYGYYYITTTTGTNVTIDSALKDVTVIDKNEVIPPPDKTESTGTYTDVSAATAKVGDTVNYKVTGTITRYVGKTLVTNLYFSDTMTSGLTPGAVTDIVVKVKGPNAEAQTTLTSGTDYTAAVSGQTITITLPTATVADGVPTFKFETGTTYEITYKAIVNANSIVPGKDSNTVTLYYNNNQKVGEDSTTIENYQITLTKQDATSKAKLAEAEFKLYDAQTGGNEVSVVLVPFATAYPDAETADADYGTAKSTVNNVYRKATSEETGVTMVTGTTGIIEIRGLNNGSYYFEETKAPTSYNALTGRTEATTITDANATISVDNASGAELPSTGGIGTTIFYIIGAILVIGAGVVLVTRRRMNVQ